MTCNPNWKEIKDQLLPDEEAHNRSDLLVRIFHTKNKRLEVELINKGILGDVIFLCNKVPEDGLSTCSLATNT